MKPRRPNRLQRKSRGKAKSNVNEKKILPYVVIVGCVIFAAFASLSSTRIGVGIDSSSSFLAWEINHHNVTPATETRTVSTDVLPSKFQTNGKLQEQQRQQRQLETSVLERPFVQVNKKDYIMKGVDNAAPIVIEKYKLIFFTIQKTGCTVWKQLAKRIMGRPDWKNGKTWPISATGLTYLSDYSVENASHIMNDPTYIRATFVRDPKERFVSAYLDKAVNTRMYYQTCCMKKKKWTKKEKEQCYRDGKNFSNFVEVTRTCGNTHWKTQSSFIRDKYIPTLDFIGHLETAAQDAKTLLEKIGAWEEFGKSGWGADDNESIFQSTSSVKHKTGNGSQDSKKRLSKYFTPELEIEIEERFAKDYELFGLPVVKVDYTAIT